eukprot:IDg9434t1
MELNALQTEHASVPSTNRASWLKNDELFYGADRQTLWKAVDWWTRRSMERTDRVRHRGVDSRHAQVQRRSRNECAILSKNRQLRTGANRYDALITYKGLKQCENKDQLTSTGQLKFQTCATYDTGVAAVPRICAILGAHACERSSPLRSRARAVCRIFFPLAFRSCLPGVASARLCRELLCLVACFIHAQRRKFTVPASTAERCCPVSAAEVRHDNIASILYAALQAENICRDRVVRLSGATRASASPLEMTSRSVSYALPRLSPDVGTDCYTRTQRRACSTACVVLLLNCSLLTHSLASEL